MYKKNHLIYRDIRLKHKHPPLRTESSTYLCRIVSFQAELAPNALQKVMCRSKLFVGRMSLVGQASSNLRGSCCGDGLRDLGDLAAGTDDLLTLTVLVELNVLVLSLRSLPDLNFAATTDDTDSHCGE